MLPINNKLNPDKIFAIIKVFFLPQAFVDQQAKNVLGTWITADTATFTNILPPKKKLLTPWEKIGMYSINT